jgi:hypothetical protein
VTDKQTQRGDGGPQLQAGRDINVSFELSVEAAREVYAAQAEHLRAELTVHAEATVNSRLADFEQRLMRAFGVHPELLQTFADPDFQFNVLEAQRSAARSGKVEDLDLLVDLLSQRASTPPTPRLSMATRRALDVAGQLPSDSLAGLTAIWYSLSLTPLNTDLASSLASAETFVTAIVAAGLPEGHGWLQDLDILDCIQLGGLGSLKSLPTLLGDRLEGFTCRGFTFEEAAQVRSSLTAVDPRLAELVVRHPLSDDRFCLLGMSEEQVRELAASMSPHLDQEPDGHRVLEEAIVLNGYKERSPDFAGKLRERFSQHPNLQLLDEWWGENFRSLYMTPVGIVVAYANLRRLLPALGVPPLETVLA